MGWSLNQAFFGSGRLSRCIAIAPNLLRQTIIFTTAEVARKGGSSSNNSNSSTSSSSSNDSNDSSNINHHSHEQHLNNHNNCSGQRGVACRCRLVRFLAAEAIELKAVKTQLPFRFSSGTVPLAKPAPMPLGSAGCSWVVVPALPCSELFGRLSGSSMGRSCGHQARLPTSESSSTGVPKASAQCFHADMHLVPTTHAHALSRNLHTLPMQKLEL